MIITRNQGFTLLELMIVLLVAGVLLAFALPAYQGYVKRSQAQTAAADLVTLSLAMENLYQRQLQYPVPAANPTTTTSATISYIASGGASKLWFPARADRFVYTVNITSGTYALQAAGLENMSGCVLRLDSSNTRSVTGPQACGGFAAW